MKKSKTVGASNDKKLILVVAVLALLLVVVLGPKLLGGGGSSQSAPAAASVAPLPALYNEPLVLRPSTFTSGPTGRNPFTAVR